VISTGWKVLNSFTSSGAAFSPEPAEIDTELIDLAIPCSGMSFCQIGLASSTIATHAMYIYGTNGSSEDGQQVTGYFNSRLLTVTFAASGLSIPSGIFPSLDKQGSFTNLDTAAMTELASGNETGALLLNSYLHMTGNKAMAPDNAVGTDETDEYENYYSNDGTIAATGPAWVAIPCGTFDYIQIQLVAAAAATLSPMFCLYS